MSDDFGVSMSDTNGQPSRQDKLDQTAQTIFDEQVLDAEPGRVRRVRFVKVRGGCRVASCIYMAHTCPSRWHRLLNLGVRRVV